MAGAAGVITPPAHASSVTRFIFFAAAIISTFTTVVELIGAVYGVSQITIDIWISQIVTMAVALGLTYHVYYDNQGTG